MTSGTIIVQSVVLYSNLSETVDPYPTNRTFMHNLDVCDDLGVRGLQSEDLLDTVVARSHLDAEGHGRTARETIVLLQVDRLVGELFHVECPEQAGDSKENLLFGKRDSRADAATTGCN